MPVLSEFVENFSTKLDFENKAVTVTHPDGRCLKLSIKEASAVMNELGSMLHQYLLWQEP